MNRKQLLIPVIIILVILCAVSLLAMPQLKRFATSGAATPAEQPAKEAAGTSASRSRQGFDSDSAPRPGGDFDAPGQPSYEVLQQMKGVGPDGQRNLYFYTEEQARKMGLKKYTDGPCKGYYQGEEWWCR